MQNLLALRAVQFAPILSNWVYLHKILIPKELVARGSARPMTDYGKEKSRRLSEELNK